MDPLRKTVIRLTVYGLVMGWIIGDLFVWHGFLRQRIDRADPNTPEAIARAKAQGVVARVFNHQITRSQLDRAVAERLWREGRNAETVDPATARMVRYAALNDLIDHELLRVKAKAHGPDLPVNPDDLEERYQRFLARFSSEMEMVAAARKQGIASKQELRERIAAWMQQEAYVESKIAPLSEISEEEVRAWWEQNRDSLKHPARLRLRHVFAPTLDRNEAEVKQAVLEWFDQLQSGSATWEDLARKHSGDPASKSRGGDLGWVTEGRLPADFAAAVSDLKTAAPSIIRTSIGWHIVEVMEREPAKPRVWDEAKEEVRAALKTARRDQAVREYKDALRRFEEHKIQVFNDMVER